MNEQKEKLKIPNMIYIYSWNSFHDYVLNVTVFILKDTPSS